MRVVLGAILCLNEPLVLQRFEFELARCWLVVAGCWLQLVGWLVQQ
jgi:hypothetical protein